MVPRLKATLRSWFARGRLEREMREEMSGHLECAIEDWMARGYSRFEAEREAHREFGNLRRIQEEGREARGALWIESTQADIRFGVRQIRKAPLSAVTIVLVLTLGIVANAGLFTVYHSMLTAPPVGMERDESLVRIREINRETLLREEIDELAKRTDLFTGLAYVANPTTAAFTAKESEGPSEAAVVYVNSDYFEVLRARPLKGRSLAIGTGDDPFMSAARVVIGHDLWQTQFGGVEEAIGSQLRLNDALFTIVGVAPPGFVGVDGTSGGPPRIWAPLEARWLVDPQASEDSGNFYRSVVARLQPGVPADRAEAAVRTIAEQSISADSRYESWTERGLPRPGADVAPLLEYNEQPFSANDDIVVGGTLLSVLTLLILLITCTNVTALVVGRSLGRRREIATRLSVGASRSRIVRQLVTESVLYALAAGALSITLIFVAVRIFGRLMPDTAINLAWPSIAFTFLFALGTGILFGLSPALHATRFTLSDVLKDAGTGISHSRNRLQRMLLVAQIALTQPLLLGLAVVLAAFVGMNSFRSSPFEERIVTVSLSTAGRFSFGSAEESARASRLWSNDLQMLRDRLSQLPGVVGVVPVEEFRRAIPAPAVHPADRIQGRASELAGATLVGQGIAPGFLSLMGIRLVAGRDFDGAIPADSSAIIIGSELAQRLWGNASPIGRRLISGRAQEVRTVIGVVDDKSTSPQLRGDPGASPFFVRMGARPTALRIRTADPVDGISPAIRRVIRETTPTIPIARMTTLAAELDETRRTALLAGGSATAGGLLALFLSAIGLYSLVSLGTRQRTREIGIRSALGAGRRQVVSLFFATGFKLSVIGVFVGLPLGFFAMRQLEAYGDTDFGIVPLLAPIALSVMLVASVAAFIPARRAAGCNPFDAIRDTT